MQVQQENAQRLDSHDRRHDMLRYILDFYGMVWHGMAWYGMAWYGMVWYGMVWYGMVCESLREVQSPDPADAIVPAGLSRASHTDCTPNSHVQHV